uniref:arginine-hydroxylase NDUFAF5, mitochondrial-like isoform X1 n=1 Tax=Myxine glutinosa TaxID=7769 RepID=UPI00358E13BD
MATLLKALQCSRRTLVSTFCRSHRGLNSAGVMDVFDRALKRKQKRWAAERDDAAHFDYLRRKVGEMVADRTMDISRSFPVALDVGAGRGYVSEHITKETVELMIQTDIAAACLNNPLPTDVHNLRVLADEENLPFADDAFHLVVSSLAFHWINNLPKAFSEVLRVLRPDGAFVLAMLGADSLYELRCSLQLAEQEREGGISPHISPFTSLTDVGDLLARIGFNLLTVDSDEIVVIYPSVYHLLDDLQGMGESNCAWQRRLLLHRDTLAAAAAIYHELYGGKDGVPATFHVLHAIGWKPHESQAQPACRGSATASFAELERLRNTQRSQRSPTSTTESHGDSNVAPNS